MVTMAQSTANWCNTHSRGSHAFTHTLISTQLQPRCAKRQVSYYRIWNAFKKKKFEGTASPKEFFFKLGSQLFLRWSFTVFMIGWCCCAIMFLLFRSSSFAVLCCHVYATSISTMYFDNLIVLLCCRVYHCYIKILACIWSSKCVLPCRYVSHLHLLYSALLSSLQNLCTFAHCLYVLFWINMHSRMMLYTQREWERERDGWMDGLL